MRIVLDTNVLVSAVRSRRGASFKLLSLVDSGRFTIALSVPLVLEYESAMLRASRDVRLPKRVVTNILDYLCKIGHRQEIFFLWRPHLRDARDDMVLELAVAAGCDGIVTFNTRDFGAAREFGLNVRTLPDFLTK